MLQKRADQTNPGHGYADPHADRMIAAGCLLMLIPALYVIGVLIFYGWPLAYELLPRTMQPIAPAGWAQTLAVVASVEGADNKPLEAIDMALIEAVQYTYDMRVGRVGNTPTTLAEAQALGERYNATVVIWATVDEAGYTVHLTPMEPLDEAEPDSVAVTIDPGSQTDLDEVTDFAVLFYGLHTYELDYWRADGIVSAVFTPFSAAGLDPVLRDFYLAEVARARNAYSDASALVDAALEDDPDNTTMRALQAVIYRDLGNFTAAVETANAVLEADPDRHQMLLLRGDIFYQQGDDTQAVEDLTRFLEHEPENLRALSIRAMAYQRLDRIDEAIADYVRIAEIDGEQYEALVSSARLRAQSGDLEGALADFDKALEIAGRASDLLTARSTVLKARALVFMEAGYYVEARADYQALVDEAPYSAEYVILLGTVDWAQGDEDAARAIWERDFNIYDSSSQASAYNNLAWGLSQIGYFEPALPYIEQSLAISPLDPNSLHTLGYIYLGLGRYEDALIAFRDAINQGLGYTAVYRDLGDTYAGLGRYEEAISAYQQYLEFDPAALDRSDVILTMGMLQQELEPR